MILPLFCFSSQRELFEIRKVELGQSKKESHKFFQAESVQLTGTYTQRGTPVDLSGTNTIVVWEINGWSDYTNTYAISTGVVSSASNVVTFALTPQEANLLPGTYIGFIRSLHSVSNELVQDIVLSYQTIAVEWSPASSNYNRVAPLPAPQVGSYTNRAIWFLSSAPHRDISQIWKVEDAPTLPIPTKFFMAEGIRLSGRATKGGSAMDLSDTNTIYVWEINGWEDYTNTYAIAIGTASTNGQLSFELPPWQSNIPDGTYRGFVRALQSDGTNLTTSEVLARQNITVEWSPDSRHYNLVGPITAPLYYTAGPQGPQGIQGPAGSNGLDGATGPQGPAGTNDVERIIALETNPPASGVEGSVQINQAGKLSGSSNLIWSAENKAFVHRSTNGVMYRIYKNGAVADANLIYRLANEGGKAVLRLGDNGVDRLVLSGDGSITLGGVTHTNWFEADPIALPVVTRLAAGTDAFGGILLDRKISNWSEVGVTYSNAVRINNPITVTNNSTWTGWTTTGSLVASNQILLLTGQYLLSPVQSNGVARYEVNSYSSQNGTSETIELLAGTNAVAYPYYSTNAQLKISVGNVSPGATVGLYVSGVTLVGYENLTEAAVAKYVAGLRRTDYESNPDDMTSKRYVDATQTAAEKHADSGLSAYAADPSKTLKADRLEMGNYTLVGSGAWRGANFTQSADSATIGTRFNENILSLESGLSVVEVKSVSVAETNATISLYAQNIAGDPVISCTTNLVTGTWTNIPATITSLGSGNYTATVDISGFGPTGFFRSYAVTSLNLVGQMTVHVPVLNMNSNRITGVSEIVFTNGWKIICTTNGLGFAAP